MLVKWPRKLKGMQINKRSFLPRPHIVQDNCNCVYCVVMAYIINAVIHWRQALSKTSSDLAVVCAEKNIFSDKMSCFLADSHVALRWQCFPEPDII